MARIRSIKPEFFRHESLYEAEKASGLPLRLAFAGLWTAADREGRFRWQPRALKLDCLPYDECEFSLVLEALARSGFIRRYEIDGESFGFIPAWKNHQIINNRESDSKLPDPRVNDASATRHEPAQGEGKGREGEGKGARDDLKIRTGNFQQAIVQAFASANSPNLPETSRAGLWLSQGFQEDICLAVIAELVRKKPSITTLNYFDSAIRDAHAGKAPPRLAVAMAPEEINWDRVLTDFKKYGRWSQWAGPDLDSPACRAPPEMLQKHGLAIIHDAPPIPIPKTMMGSA